MRGRPLIEPYVRFSLIRLSDSGCPLQGKALGPGLLPQFGEADKTEVREEFVGKLLEGFARLCPALCNKSPQPFMYPRVQFPKCWTGIKDREIVAPSPNDWIESLLSGNVIQCLFEKLSPDVGVFKEIFL